jgi:hypothetical protein
MTMKRLFFLTLMTVGMVQITTFAEGKIRLREFIFTSTSYDDGFIEISVKSTADAEVSWILDPFRKPQPSQQPWKRKIKLSQNKIKAFFHILGASRFLKMKNGRGQRPDEASITLSELDAGKIRHSITYPAGEFPNELTELRSQLDAIYEEAKSSR